MNEKETNPNLSTQKVLLPGHEPGWNDPPMWVYSSTQNSSATPNKRLLNKRVGFPLSSTRVAGTECTSEITSKTVNMPPTLQSPINLTTVSQSPSLLLPDKGTDVNKTKIEFDKNQALNDSLANFQAVIDKHISEKNKADDVKKRLDLMKVAWLNDKLNVSIYQQILDLSSALKEGNIEEADQIHVALMVGNASLCSSWIPGVRHIILELKSKFQKSNNEQPHDSQPQLLLVEGKEAN